MIVSLTLIVMALSLSLGSQHLGLHRIVSSLLNEQSSDSFTLNTLRLPRMLLAALVGAALGGSGLVLQSMIRNPLASPDIIGITSGASAAAVGFLAFFSRYSVWFGCPSSPLSAHLLQAL